MSTTRLIKLKLLTQTELVKVETSARTLGELKSESIVKGLGIDWANAKLIDRASKASFDLDESVLPAIDALMFVTPTKTKSGADLPYKEVKAKIKEYKEKGGVVNFNYTQATTSELNIFWNKVSTTKPSTSSKPTVAEVKKVVTSVQTAKEVVKEDTILVKDIAEVVTKPDLNTEAQYLKSKFYR
jgi:hypothetical protein